MPRRAPDEVTEHRVTFGNYERAFVTEVKTDIEKAVKLTAVTAVAVPLATLGGLGLLGFGIYKGGQMIGKGLNEFQLLDWQTVPLATEIKDAWSGLKWGVDSPEDTPSLAEIDEATKEYSWWQKQELWLYVVSGGAFGKSHEELRAENALYESRKNATGSSRT